MNGGCGGPSTTPIPVEDANLVIRQEWLKLVEAQVSDLKTRLQQLGPSREISYAVTKADECLLWARESVRG